MRAKRIELPLRTHRAQCLTGPDGHGRVTALALSQLAGAQGVDGGGAEHLLERGRVIDRESRRSADVNAGLAAHATARDEVERKAVGGSVVEP